MLASFDIFRKVRTMEPINSSTGGVFTMLAIITAAFLVICSLRDSVLETRYETLLTVRGGQTQLLPVKLDLLFPHMPCEVLTVEFNDHLDNNIPDLESFLTLWRANKDGTQELYSRKTLLADEKISLLTALHEQIACKINGTLLIPKTPGLLSFKAEAQGNLLELIEFEKTINTSMHYRLDLLHFGSKPSEMNLTVTHSSRNIAAYLSHLEAQYAKKKLVYFQDFTQDEGKMNYFSHVKLVPVRFEGEEDQDSMRYRHSLWAGKTVTESLTAQVTFQIEIEPICVVYRQKPIDYYQLSINLLAIVGGTVATLGLMNSLGQNFLSRVL